MPILQCRGPLTFFAVLAVPYVHYGQKSHAPEVTTHHTIYKHLCVGLMWGVSGCARVCDTSLEPFRHPNVRMSASLEPARAARPQLEKMYFLLHKAPIYDRS